MWLAYGCVTAIRRIEMLARKERLQFVQLDERSPDERSPDELPEVFLPFEPQHRDAHAPGQVAKRDRRAASRERLRAIRL